jgi:DNA-directed RNA polymerase subunit N (RpoN/RPB10)
MRLLFIFFISLSLTFCKKIEPTYYYNFYGKDNALIKKNKYVLKLTKAFDNEYLMNIEGDHNYKQTIKIKIDSLGISRYCDSHFVVTHHFDSTENEAFCYSAPPFIHKQVEWTKKKQYIVDNKPYEVICYLENSGSSMLNSSYYLKDFGFICYYNCLIDRYIICDSIKDVNFDLTVLHKINQLLITDTLTFERYIFNKAYPNYHRGNAIE